MCQAISQKVFQKFVAQNYHPISPQQGTSIETTNGNGSEQSSSKLSYEELENHWIIVLSIDQLPDYYILEEEGEEHVFGDDVGDGNGDVADCSDEYYDYEDAVVDVMMMKELNYVIAITEVLGSYFIEQTMFSDGLAEMKSKEMMLIERGDAGYCRNKHIHANAYNKICEAMKAYLSKENLEMVYHPHTT